jgi:predicted NBD/HSP70 family sugar kinase
MKKLSKLLCAVLVLAILCSSLISEFGITSSDVDYIGITADECSGAPLSIASDLENALGIKCLATSLIGATTLGEAYVSNDTDSLVMLKIDDKIECGIVIYKELYADGHVINKNVAHTVIDFGGFECSCGKRGCFEAYAGISGLRRIAAGCGVEGAGSITHSELFSLNTAEAEKAKKAYIEYLATGITNIINLFQPRHLVLDGPFTKVGDSLMTPMMDIILRDQYTHSMPNKGSIRFATVDVDTASIGAALLRR